MTVRELKEKLNNIENDNVLDMEISLVIDDDDLIGDMIDTIIGEPSDDFDPDDVDSEEYKNRNDIYGYLCESMRMPLTHFEIRQYGLSDENEKKFCLISNAWDASKYDE